MRIGHRSWLGGGSDGERGQALILALFVLLIMSMAAGLVAAEIQLVLRAMNEQTARARLRTLEDAGVAEALAHLAEGRGVPVIPRRLDGGTIDWDSRNADEGRLVVRVDVAYRGFRAAVELEVVPLSGEPPQLIDYRAVDPSALPP